MKKMILVATVVAFYLSGCYKELERSPVKDVLVSKPWKLEKSVFGVVDSIVDCNIAKELLFRADSTGYYYYPTKCDSNDHDTLKFTWWVSKDSRYLYLRKIDGVAPAQSDMKIVYYDNKTLTLQGPDYHDRYLSGYFVAK